MGGINMELLITEVCNIEKEFINGEWTDMGIRTIRYDTDKYDLIEALKDYEENFDPCNIIESGDNFDGNVNGVQLLKQK
jgi:hypothetical protein